MSTSHPRHRRNDLAPIGRRFTIEVFGDKYGGASALAVITVVLVTVCIAGCGGGEAPTGDGPSADGGDARTAADRASRSVHDVPEDDPFVPVAVAPEATQSQELTTENTKSYPNEEYQASIVQILAHRDRYDGKEVQIAGYLRVKFEGTAIYLSKEDADYGMTQNGFCVTISDRAVQYDRKYVLLEGTFEKDLMGHGSLWQGAITNITRVVELTKHD
jgi:hypothetical protein